MIPTRMIRNETMALLAADAATLAPAALANGVKLSKTNFAPSENSAVADFTEADFLGYAPIAVGLGAQIEGLDPTTLDSLIFIKGPAGGFKWISTGPWITNQTVYGYYLVDSTGLILFGCGLFPTPILLTAAGQIIEINEPSLRLPANSIS
jgi:hypothetical protein